MRLGFLNNPSIPPFLLHTVVVVIFAINYELTDVELVYAVVTLNPATGYLRGCLEHSKRVKK